MTGYQAQTVAFKPGERNVFFHLLTACNLSCRHCYINPELHGAEKVSGETIGTWLKLFYQTNRQNNLIFLGGEPTLHPDLAWGIKTAKKIGYNSVTVDTNGYLYHHLLDRITPADAVISFSLDGPTPEINDPIRGADVFDICLANLTRAAAMGFYVSVIYTVSRLNFHALHKMPALLAARGVKRFFIQVIGLRGKSASSGHDLQLTPEEWLATVPPVAEEAAALGMHVIYPKVFLDCDEKFECAGLVAENFFIFPNGRVYQCPLCEDYPVNAFTITKNRLGKNPGLTEDKFFQLRIPEGCVMNKLLQPDNLAYEPNGRPRYQISCCLLKNEIKPAAGK